MLLTRVSDFTAAGRKSLLCLICEKTSILCTVNSQLSMLMMGRRCMNNQKTQVIQNMSLFSLSQVMGPRPWSMDDKVYSQADCCFFWLVMGKALLKNES